MGLEKYNEKRDFSKTLEPKGVQKTSKGKLRFVVQKHAASRLHYDFRLEIDGVLVSWAVPKGPSANPADRRLAVQTEDHPMGYMEFEGTIPKGEYGGGTVMVWDIGTYHAEGNEDDAKDNSLMKKQLRDGNIKVVLEGGKLHGSWHLVMMKGEERQWLLMKGKDEFSGTNITFDETSILTGRDFAKIEKGKAVWHSTKSVAENVKALSKLEPVKKVTKKKTSATEDFTAEDLAKAEKLPDFPRDWRPQLATLADEPFDNDAWLFETKYDGYRALAFIESGECELVSRNGIRFDKYPEVVKALEKITDNMIIDGEVVIEDEKGKSQFQWLQNRNEKPQRGTLIFYVFDILYFNGFDLRQLELIQRKKILKALLPKLKNIIYSEHIIETGTEAFRKVEKAGGEGIIAKKISSKYYTDKRSKDWLKIKTEMQQEMVIGGYTDPQGSRVGIGALLCGYYKDGGFQYSGKVGSGFNEESLNDLRKKLDKLERKTSPFVKAPKMKDAHWVEPKLLAQIKFTEWTETGSMRHPVFLGLRDDKSAKKVIAEKPVVHTETIDDSTETPATRVKKTAMPKTKEEKSVAKPTKAAKKSTGNSTPPENPGRVEFSNLDKIFWPKENITKGDVVRYYDEISEYILPYLIDRPQSLRRTPDGLKSPGFFQKNVAGSVPKWIKTKKIKSESAEEAVEWLLCQDRETLLFLANYGCIELNPWSSRVGSLDNPDYIIFDLDPNKADMNKLVTTALKVKEVLDKLQIKAYVKTSGGKGIHVFIPVLPKYTYEQTRDFSLLISQMVNRELPDITSLERMPNKRVGKVYLDFLQNGRGKTMASIYSIRPREGAGVSTPLDWDEINFDLDLTAFNIHTVPDRLREKGDLWKNFFNDSLDLKALLKSLT
ncbi:MAG TPA: DNA ligase D [Flavobacterium sp.]|jgi:bifunctional non-homologous end joining protein LigD